MQANRALVKAQNHIASYYAATANDRTRYPALEGTVKADVCVIGGGFSGVATALTMAERGRSVVLLEANRIGWGASGRNGGQMIGGISGEAAIKRQLGAAGAKLVRDIRYRGHEIIEGRIAKYGISCDLKHGWMEVAARPSHMRAIRAHVAERIKDGDGDHLEIVEPQNMPRVLGTTAYHGGSSTLAAVICMASICALAKPAPRRTLASGFSRKRRPSLSKAAPSLGSRPSAAASRRKPSSSAGKSSTTSISRGSKA